MDMHAFLIDGKRWFLLLCPCYAICGKNEGKNFKSDKSQDYAQKPQQNFKGGRVRNLFNSGSRNIKLFLLL
jgi:hypothetical protein